MEYQNSQPVAGPAAGQPVAAAGQPVAGQPVSGPVAGLPGAGLSVPAGTGRTVISEAAIAKVAGIAARSVPGVYSLGSGPSRALGAIRDAVGSADHAAGVRVEVGETQVAVDIDLVAVYGTPLHALADQIRTAVYSAVEELVGLEVIEVNIEINDVYVPGPAKPAPSAEARPVREAIQ
ncbi:Alkaline shock protein 23 [Arthrobacter sp. Bi26]|uniref:Asp23/Gls24 family envelope stress response protein n=1 Tax=Arthrobacter sp. Bi26 TaxID=2822350 RepID=UPI001DA7168D|nr:Asp23/Gls24 family envelope stress response protein [Arthrobacter sp. Bi26]CAH0192783.1 Alkaline shock protein 23 [Arthrobacter sp. Bi26]